MIVLFRLFLMTCFFSSFFGFYAFAQTPLFLTGQKTGNLDQSAILLAVGTGAATVSSPMLSHSAGFPISTFRFFYGDNMLNDNSVVSPTTIKATRELNIISGLLGAGADAYIQFRNGGNLPLTAGTTSYFKLGGAPTVTGLSATVGGLLGLANVYNIYGRGYSGAANYSTAGNNENPGTAAGTANGTTTRLLIDKNGTWYAAVTPDADYNSVRLNVAFSSSLDLLSLSRSLDVNVYNVFYYTTPDSINCGLPTFTTPGEVQGVSLNLGAATSLLALDSAVKDPQKAIDQSDLTYSRITSGALGVATAVSQTIMFNGLGTTNDVVKLRLSLPLSALTAAILNNVTIKAFNKAGQQVGTAQSLTNLLSLDVLGLLGNDTPFDINYKPGGRFDKVQISLGNLVSIGANILGGGLRIYEVVRVTEAPVISVQPANTTICLKNNASFSATASGTALSYSWEYYTGTAWTTTGTDSSGLSITNPPISFNARKYRVKVAGGFCPAAQTTITSSEAQLNINTLPIAPPVAIVP